MYVLLVFIAGIFIGLIVGLAIGLRFGGRRAVRRIADGEYHKLLDKAGLD
jgi:hypothetical protein